MRGTASLARVAALVAVVIAAAFTVVVLLKGASGGYTVQARFQNASQLVKGNLVQVSGIRAGTVENIRLTPDGQAELTLNIDEKYAPLRRGTQATVRQASLSGVANRYVDLRLAGAKSPAIPDGGVPHHDFHVFGVYPGVGLLRSGDATEPLRVLESCRITPGRVLEVEGASVTVAARPLVWDGRRLRLGAPAVRRADWRRDGLGFLRELRPGDLVSLHWDWVCDSLTPRQARMLGAYTRRMLGLANRASAPAALA